MTKKLLYFVSSHHGRSSIAETWANKLKLSNWAFKSGGWVDTKRSPLTIKAMNELNFDLSSKPAQLVDYSLMEKADYIVAIYDFHHDSQIPIPLQHREKLIEWDIKNPNLIAHTPIDEWASYQEICDEIASKVKHLESSLNVFM